MQNTYCISLIIPIYNAETYIQRCLSSICMQSLQNIEIICVDDGSTDDTCRIIEQFHDNRIKLITLPHLGVSNARNIGIINATSEYIQFIDADDTIEPNCCEVAYSYAIKNQADCVFFGTNLITESGIPQWIKDCTNTNNRFYRKFEDEILFNIKGTKPFIWNQIIKRSLLIKKQISFDSSLILGEDQAFQFAYLPYAKNIVMIDTPLYNHYIYNTSTTFSIYENIEEKIILHLDVVASILSESKYHSLNFQCKTCIWAIDFLYNDIINLSSGPIKLKTKSTFSKYHRLMRILPPFWQDKAVQIGAIKTAKNTFILKVLRKLFYRP